MKPPALDITELIEMYQGKQALLQTWQELDDDRQVRNRTYIRELAKRTRQCRTYILNRNTPEAEVFRT